MAKRYEGCPEDRADFSDCLLRFSTLPSLSVMKLQNDRGPVSKDLGIRAAIFYIIGCSVLARIAHVPSGKKQSKAVRRVRQMLTGGNIKKKKRLDHPGSRVRTRDRAVSYIEKCIALYLAGDLENGLGKQVDGSDLRSEFIRGDVILGQILSVLEECPSLRHILPISAMSFILVLIELMMLGKLGDGGDVNAEGLEDLQQDDIYFALERASCNLVKNFHPFSGVVSGGDGRPLFSPSCVFERDGEIAKIAISNVALAGAVSIGARMRSPSSTRMEVDSGEQDKLKIDSFFAFVIDSVIGKSEEQLEYETVLDEAEEFLRGDAKETVVAQRYLKPFYKVYETLQKCNKVSVIAYGEPGVLSGSRHVPVAVDSRLKEMGKEGMSSQAALVDDVELDIRSFRRDKSSSLDSEQVYVRKDGKKVNRYAFRNSADVCKLLYGCMRLAEKFVNEAELKAGEDVPVSTRCKVLKSELERDFFLGLFSCDLSGSIVRLYEDYIFSFVMRHFDEEEGVSLNLKAETKRRNVIRAGKKGRKGNVMEASKDAQSPQHGANLALDDEDWA